MAAETPEFVLTVRLAEPFREGVGEVFMVSTPVANLGELVPVLRAALPGFAENYDEGYVFAVNGRIILSGERTTALASGDEVELMLALAGG